MQEGKTGEQLIHGVNAVAVNTCTNGLQLIMENIASERDQKIEELTNFVRNTNEFLIGTMSSLGWNVENTEKDEEKLICPFDSSHRLYQKSVEKHLEHCLWKAEGYSEEDVPLSIPCVPPDASSSIKVDEQLMENIFQLAKTQCPSFQGGGGNRLIPRTSNRLLADFTPEERKVLYDYVVANTEPPDMGEDIADLNKAEKTESKKFSYLELLAQERNLKRRRAKHRGVHTNKKSHVEIMREVINQQMEMLMEHLAEKDHSNELSPDVTEAEAAKKPSRDYSRDSQYEAESKNSWIPPATSERNFVNGSDYIQMRRSDSRRDLSSESRRYSSRSDSISAGSHKTHRSRHHHPSSSRSRDPRERKSHRHSEEWKKPKKHSRDRSKDRHHHKHKKHKSKSKRSRDRDEGRSRKR